MKLTRWNREETPSIPLLKKLLKEEGLESFSWTDSRGAYYYPHQHTESEIRWIVKGSMKVRVSTEIVQLKPGDRLDIPPGTLHEVWMDPSEETIYLCAAH